MTAKRKAKTASKSRRSRVIEQMKEPLSLLETLKEEGMARAIDFIGMASAAAKNVQKDKVIEQLRDGVKSLGLISREEASSLRHRIAALEERVRELEAVIQVDSEE